MTYSRNRAFRTAFGRAYREAEPGTPWPEIVRRAINSTAPSFYVGYDTVMRQLPRYRRMKAERRGRAACGRWADICARVEALLDSGLNQSQAVTRLMCESAPRFYIGMCTARRILKNAGI